MSRIHQLRHKFVEFVPEEVEEGVLYVSMEYATAVHNCCCGCGNKVVTPLKPVCWSLTFDGETVTLNPSVGNWGFRCRSHYWVKRSRVIWSHDMGDQEIGQLRARDARSRAEYFRGRVPTLEPVRAKRGLLARWFKRDR